MGDNLRHDRSVMGGMWCYPSQNNIDKRKSRLQLMVQKAKKMNSQIEEQEEDDRNVRQNSLWPEGKNHVI